VCALWSKALKTLKDSFLRYGSANPDIDGEDGATILRAAIDRRRLFREPSIAKRLDMNIGEW